MHTFLYGPVERKNQDLQQAEVEVIFIAFN